MRHCSPGTTPTRLARDAHYLSLLSRAKAGLIRNLGEILDEKKRLAGLARDKKRGTGRNREKQQREQRAAWSSSRKSGRSSGPPVRPHQGAAPRGRQAQARRKAPGALIEGLGRIVAKPKRAPQAQGPALRNERTPDASAADAFAALKGRLSLPTRGELANRFGTPRQEGGTTWKGVFIRAADQPQLFRHRPEGSRATARRGVAHFADVFNAIKRATSSRSRTRS
jgi:septal ring factor EnvC (AmiA/AmiB activator)